MNDFQPCLACGSGLELARNAGVFCGENSWHYGCAPRELTGKNKVGTVRLLNMEIIIIIKLTNKKCILNKMCGFFQCSHMTV